MPRRPRRADPQRTVLDFHVDAVAGLPEEAGRNAGEAVLDFEAHAGLGGGEGVGDFGFRVGSPQASSIAWSAISPDRRTYCGAICRGSAAHERAAPMRGRAGDVGDAVRRRRGVRKSRGGFRRRLKHQRSAAEKRAQEYLQATITADVVKRAPYQRTSERAAAANRPGEARQAVRDHLRQPAGARCEENPFAWQLRAARVWRGRDRGRTLHERASLRQRPKTCAG